MAYSKRQSGIGSVMVTRWAWYNLKCVFSYGYFLVKFFVVGHTLFSSHVTEGLFCHSEQSMMSLILALLLVGRSAMLNSLGHG